MWSDIDELRNIIEGKDPYTGRLPQDAPAETHRFKLRQPRPVAVSARAIRNRLWMQKKRAAFKARGLTVLGRPFKRPENHPTAKQPIETPVIAPQTL